MKSNLRKTPKRRKSIAIQMIGGYVNKTVILIQGIFLIPIYLQFIGDRTYGMWLASGGILVWLGFLDFGIGNLITQRVSNAFGKKNYENTVSYFINGFYVFLCLDFLFIITSITLSFFIFHWLKARDDEIFILQVCFQLACITAAIEFLNNCLRNFMQAVQRPLFPIVSMIIFRIIGLISIIYFLYKDLGLWSIPIGSLLHSFPVFCLNIFYCVKLVFQLNGTYKANFLVIKEYFKLSPILLAGRFGNSLVANIEPTLIGIILKPELAPAFVIMRRAGDMIEQFIQTIIASIFPSFSHLYSQGDNEKINKAISMIMTICFATCLIGFGVYIFLNESFIALWVGSDKYLGNGITTLIAISIFLKVIYRFLSSLIIASGDISYPSIFLLVEAILRILFMWAFLLWLNIGGLPLGMLVSGSILCFVLVNRLQKLQEMFTTVNKLWVQLFISLFIIIGISFINEKIQFYKIENWIDFLLSSIIIFVCLACITMSVYPSLLQLLPFSSKKFEL